MQGTTQVSLVSFPRKTLIDFKLFIVQKHCEQAATKIEHGDRINNYYEFKVSKLCFFVIFHHILHNQTVFQIFVGDLIDFLLELSSS